LSSANGFNVSFTIDEKAEFMDFYFIHNTHTQLEKEENGGYKWITTEISFLKM
jgi:hypothetical protein